MTDDADILAVVIRRLEWMIANPQTPEWVAIKLREIIEQIRMEIEP
jgi:hypothetical protein